MWCCLPQPFRFPTVHTPPHSRGGSRVRRHRMSPFSPCLPAFPHMSPSSACLRHTSSLPFFLPLPCLSSFPSSRSYLRCQLLPWPVFLLSSPSTLSPQFPAEMPAGNSKPNGHVLRAGSQTGHWRYKSEKCMLLPFRETRRSDRGRQLTPGSGESGSMLDLRYCTSCRRAIGLACGSQKRLLGESKAWAYYWGQRQGVQTKRTACAKPGKSIKHSVRPEDKASAGISHRRKLMFLGVRANAP